MIKTLIGLALVAWVAAQDCGRTPIPPQPSDVVYKEGKIVGGVTVTPGSFPWQIELQRQSIFQWSFICGGSVIASKYVLTAAHCIGSTTASSFRIRAGGFDRSATESDRVTVGAQRHWVHPEYSTSGPAPATYDIAIIKLQQGLTFGDRIQPVCLPQSDAGVIVEPNTCYVTGWGRTVGGGSVANQLQQIHVPFVNTANCNAEYNGIVDETMVCAGQDDKSACNGDSGGPLVVKDAGDDLYYQYGVVSWGRSTCANAPGVFVRAAFFHDYIQGVMLEGGN